MDASLHGIGGYNILTGKAWCFQLPIDCRLRTTLNSLEFIAVLVAIWMDDLNEESYLNYVFSAKRAVCLLQAAEEIKLH